MRYAIMQDIVFLPDPGRCLSHPV